MTIALALAFVGMLFLMAAVLKGSTALAWITIVIAAAGLVLLAGVWLNLLRSNRKILLGLLIGSQVALIGGPFVVGYHLGKVATNSLDPVKNSGVAVWVSDQNWHVAPRLAIDIPNGRWAVELTSSELKRDDVGKNAEVLVVLWGKASLSDPHPGDRNAETLPPEVQKPLEFWVDPREVKFHNPSGDPLPATGSDKIKAQVFQVTADDFFARVASEKHTDGGPAIFDVATTSDPPPTLYTPTITGYVIDVPDLGPAGTETKCTTPESYALPQEIHGLVAPHDHWYDVTCSAPPTSVVLTLKGNEHVDTSGLPAQRDASASSDSQNTSSNTQEWTTQAASTAATPSGHLGGFWVNVADPAIAAKAQRNILYAGIFYGIGGGLLAGWIVFLVPLGVNWFRQR